MFLLKLWKELDYSFSILGRLSVAKLCLTLVTPWTVACQAHPLMGFSRKEYWTGLPFPSPGDLPDPGIEHADSGRQILHC